MLKPMSKFGHYLVESQVGVGSVGTVYRAHRVDDKQPVALKVLNIHHSGDQSLITMFREEAEVGLQLSHPNIVRTLDVGYEQDRYYIVFEYVVGTPLGEILERGKLPESQCIWILRQVGQALRQLNEKKIVHQDIKPDNLLIEKNGNVKLSDLGFARVPKGKMKWEGLAVGTPHYISPEVARGQEQVDCRADIYSLGATIYHAATGRPPFEADEEVDVLKAHVYQRLITPRVYNPDLSAEFCYVLCRMLEKDPRQRYQKPEEMLLALRSLGVKAEPVVNGK
ncbi:MAG TPA: serine/threonine-protein kinase [Planctomycetota bacterium]|jgi:serine/threonine-protein kinase